MIIALAQLNPIIGDLKGNATKITSFIEKARAAGAQLVIFPEMAVPGYPPKDLLLKPSFVQQTVETTEKLAAHAKDGISVMVGYVRPNPNPIGRRLHNSIALLQDGKLEASFDKALLPTYDVFDEHRYFEPNSENNTVNLWLGQRSVRFGVTICEDLWNDERVLERRLYHQNPLEAVYSEGAEIVINASASPFVAEKQSLRRKLLGGQAVATGLPLILVNQVGGNDELIFDGGSCVFDSKGRIVAQAKSFQEDLLIVDFDDLDAARREPDQKLIPSVWDALVLGTRDYVQKCGFKNVVLGLSGGIDSALTAAIAVDALGKEHVYGVAMPSRYSSDHSLTDAKILAENLGIDFKTIPIEPMHASFEEHLTPFFDGRAPDITEENIQARIRGGILMALSNKFGWLLLTTGNKSELAVGYCTLYGDMCGGLAVISDVPKTMVYELCRHKNAREGRKLIPESTLTKPPSAELRPDQHDQQSLPEYDVLDEILYAYVEMEESAEDLIARGHDEAVVRDVIRKVDFNEYKRKQAATGLKVTSRAFGVGRRMPIAAKWR